MYGGDLITCLLEVAPPPALDENALLVAIADEFDLRALPIDACRTPDPAAIAKVPFEVAEEHGFAPVGMVGERVLVAVIEPLSRAATQAISGAIGVGVVQGMTTQPRVQQALHRGYAAPLERRMTTLLATLDAHAPKPPTNAVSQSAATIAPPIDGAEAPADAPIVVHLPQAPAPQSTASPVEPPRVPLAAAIVKTGTTALKRFLRANAKKKDAAKGAVDPSPPPPPVVSSTTPLATDTSQPKLPVVAPPEFNSEAFPAAVAPSPAKRRRGPLTLDRAERLLAEASTVDEVIAIGADFLAQFVEYLAAFRVHEELAEGWDARGPGATAERVRKVGVPLDLPSSFERAKSTRAPVTAARGATELDQVVVTDLSRPVGGEISVVPILVGKRVVALLFLDDGVESIALSEIPDAIAIAARMGTTLTRLAAKKKKRADKPSLEAPVRADATAAQISIVDAVASAPVDVAAPVAIEPIAIEPVAIEPAKIEAAAPTVEEVAKPAPSVDLADPEPAAASERAARVDRPSSPRAAIDASQITGVRPVSAIPIIAAIPSGDAAPRKMTERGFPAVIAPVLDASSEPPPVATEGERAAVARVALAKAMGPRETSDLPRVQATAPKYDPTEDTADFPPSVPVQAPVEPLALPPPPAFASRRGLGPTLPREDTSSADAARAEAQSVDVVATPHMSAASLERILRHAEVVPERGNDSSRREAHSARPPPASHTVPPGERSLPKVMVAIDPAHAALVDKLVRGGRAGEQAGDELHALGVRALPALMERFPGPVSDDRATATRRAISPERAGPLLALLVRMGRIALRDVLARTSDPSPESRFWATLVLSSIVDIDAADALVPRLLDDDTAVRLVAITAARALFTKIRRSAALVVDPLIVVLLDKGSPPTLRVRTATALGELREARAAEGLILALEDTVPAVASATQQALLTLTRTDPSRSGMTWATWFATNAARHRTEWLIDSLLSPDGAEREAAASELKEQHKVYFGYYADLPQIERERAHKRYVDWWETEGRKQLLDKP